MPQNEHGAFLIRDSESRRNDYSLSVRDGDTVKHYRIRQLDEGGFFIARRTTFRTLQELVDHYSRDSDGLCVNLRKPCVQVRMFYLFIILSFFFRGNAMFHFFFYYYLTCLKTQYIVAHCALGFPTRDLELFFRNPKTRFFLHTNPGFRKRRFQLYFHTKWEFFPENVLQSCSNCRTLHVWKAIQYIFMPKKLLYKRVYYFFATFGCF